MASVADIKFDIEFHLEQQVGCLPLPFPGMDSTICDKQLKIYVYTIHTPTNERKRKRTTAFMNTLHNSPTLHVVDAMHLCFYLSVNFFFLEVSWGVVGIYTLLQRSAAWFVCTSQH